MSFIKKKNFPTPSVNFIINQTVIFTWIYFLSFIFYFCIYPVSVLCYVDFFSIFLISSITYVTWFFFLRTVLAIAGNGGETGGEQINVYVKNNNNLFFIKDCLGYYKPFLYPCTLCNQLFNIHKMTCWKSWMWLHSVQFSSVAQSCPTLCGPMNRSIAFSSVQFSCSVVSDSLQPHEPQHTRPLYPSPTPRVYPNSRPLSQWCHPTIFFFFHLFLWVGG